MFNFHVTKLKNMKKVAFLLVISFISTIILYSQSRIREVGLNYSGYNMFGVRYKAGSENSLFRLTLLNIGGSNWRQQNNSYNYKNNSQGIALNAGFEKLKLAAENVYFYYGVDLMTSYNNQTIKDENSDLKTTDRTLKTGLGLVLGFAYHFSSNVSLSAEIVPSVWYSYQKMSNSGFGLNSSQTQKLFGYGFNQDFNSFANLTLSFRLKPKHD
jgi:hypothetical protein